MEPNQLISVVILGGVIRIVYHSRNIHFYKLHSYWVPPAIFMVISSALALKSHTMAMAPLIFTIGGWVDYAASAFFLVLLFPLDIKYDKDQYFSITRYSITFRRLFYALLIIGNLTSLPYIYLFAESALAFAKDVLVVLLLSMLYIICLKSFDIRVHWVALVMGLLVELYYLISTL